MFRLVEERPDEGWREFRKTALETARPCCRLGALDAAVAVLEVAGGYGVAGFKASAMIDELTLVVPLNGLSIITMSAMTIPIADM